MERTEFSWRWFALVLAALGLTLAGCGGDGGSETDDDVADTAEISEDGGDTDDAEEDTGPDVPPLPDGPTVNYDISTIEDDFFGFPFPHALRLTEDGAPDITHFEDRGNDLLVDAKTEVLDSVQGFGPNSGVYFTFEEAIDPASLPDSALASLEDNATAYLINLEQDSPRFGDRTRAIVHFEEIAKSYTPANLLVIRPQFGFPMHPGERYAAVLTRDISLASGDPVGQQPAWEELRTSVLPPDGYPDELHQHVRTLVADLEDAGVDTEQVLVATAFEVGDPAAELQAIFDAVEELPFALPENLEMTEQTDDYIVYEGTFALADFQSGEPPYTEWGEGKILFGNDGLPIKQRDVDVRFALMIPPAPNPAYYLLPYAHGSNGDYRSFVRNGVGATLAAANVATISIDGTLSGERNPSTNTQIHLELAQSNIVGARDLIRQNFADQLQLLRFIEILNIPAEIAPGMEEGIGFATNPLIMMGHSFGAQTVALMLGTVPRLNAGVVSAGGGGAALSLIKRKGNDIDIQAALELVLGLDPDESLDENHPIVNLIAQPLLDGADPLNVAHRWNKEPIGGPKDVLMTLGTEDELTVPDTVRALAIAAGVPPVAPMADESPLWSEAGLSPETAPVELNVGVGLEPGDCYDRDPCAVTAGVVSWNSGHSAVFDLDDARFRYLNFVVSRYNGSPIIPPQLE